jgi:hypothetical protein
MLNFIPKGLADAPYKKAADKMTESIELTMEGMAKEANMSPYRLKLVFFKKENELWASVFDDKNSKLDSKEVGGLINHIFDQNLANENTATREIINNYRGTKTVSDIILEKMDGKARFIISYNKEYELDFKRLEGGKLTPIDLVESFKSIEF